MRRLRWAVLVALLVLVSGCVSMPESGPVVETRSEGDVSSSTGIYINPKPPQPGDTRPDVVRGFLVAMTATPIQTNTAREFLTKDAAASWNPEDRTITYADSTPPRESPLGVSVTLSDADQLDSQGAWQGALPRADSELDFPMSLEDGEWRIDKAPDALIVPESWFEQRFRQVSLFYFDPTASTLVPEPVFVPRGVQLASALTRALLMGPGEGLGSVIQSFVPAGMTLNLSVPISADGVAEIGLKGDAGQLSTQAIPLMMSQFAWTLRQEPQVTALRVTINGQPVPLPGGVSAYRVDGGAEYDPAGFQASSTLVALRDGLVVTGAGGAFGPTSGPLGTTAYGVRSVAMDLTATTAAVVAADGRSVLEAPVNDPDEAGPTTVLAGGTDLLAPAWDLADRLWLVDRTSKGAEISYVGPHGTGILEVPGISGEDVRMFLVSRDGTRLVAVVRRESGDTLLVSRIEQRRGGGVLGATDARRISADSDAQVPIRGLAWRTTTSVAVLNPFTSTLSQVNSASVDGSPSSPGSPSTVEGRLRSLAGSPAPDDPIYGVTRRTLIDLSGADRTPTVLPEGVTGVDYPG